MEEGLRACQMCGLTYRDDGWATCVACARRWLHRDAVGLVLGLPGALLYILLRLGLPLRHLPPVLKEQVAFARRVRSPLAFALLPALALWGVLAVDRERRQRRQDARRGGG